jgi:hypothetical protein
MTATMMTPTGIAAYFRKLMARSYPAA